ncbi:MAG: YgiT-type zinc finger protein [Deltaproteobacteria bacterium]|nr:YgiT-type zinc finger protein [Deltaproteobacteria bacterium]
MDCRIRGGRLDKVKTSLPFKLRQDSIVIIKGLPVLQCQNCNEYLMEDLVMEKVDNILDNTGKTAELEILDYAV